MSIKRPPKTAGVQHARPASRIAVAATGLPTRPGRHPAPCDPSALTAASPSTSDLLDQGLGHPRLRRLGDGRCQLRLGVRVPQADQRLHLRGENPEGVVPQQRPTLEGLIAQVQDLAPDTSRPDAVCHGFVARGQRGTHVQQKGEVDAVVVVVLEEVAALVGGSLGPGPPFPSSPPTGAYAPRPTARPSRRHWRSMAPVASESLWPSAGPEPCPASPTCRWRGPAAE